MAIKKSTIADLVRTAIEDTSDAMTDDEIDLAASLAADKIVEELEEVDVDEGPVLRPDPEDETEYEDDEE